MTENRAPVSAYFEPVGPARYRPTIRAQGAWNPGEIHFSPLGGLLVHEIDKHRMTQHGAVNTLRLGRVGFDILGFLAAEEIEIQVETIRPGHTIELIEARARIAGRTAAVGRAWFSAAGDTTAVAGGAPAPMPAPETCLPWSMRETWPGGFVESLETRVARPPIPGRATVWQRTGTVLVAGERASAHAAYIALVDTANGVAVRQRPTEWMFPNLDLTVHLHRQPLGDWVGLDTTVTFGSDGQGLTSTVLHDAAGAIGRAEQLLTVRPLGGAAAG
ncbi:thioesterase family protein [Microterricola pindariensis]|uniref:Thioesterase n=1 Tax=Microterricola pindariensis TaxID=478010 RepID=A0ABX5AYK3_9MICO|nr:thioesterase family protein [Microterricola pindariensis]PPL19983.1 thioesterase [Microterricola pindariensis]